MLSVSALLMVPQVPYTDCSTTKGVISLDPYELRLNNLTAGFIYGNDGMSSSFFKSRPERTYPYEPQKDSITMLMLPSIIPPFRLLGKFRVSVCVGRVIHDDHVSVS